MRANEKLSSVSEPPLEPKRPERVEIRNVAQPRVRRGIRAVDFEVLGRVVEVAQVGEEREVLGELVLAEHIDVRARAGRARGAGRRYVLAREREPCASHCQVVPPAHSGRGYRTGPGRQAANAEAAAANADRHHRAQHALGNVRQARDETGGRESESGRSHGGNPAGRALCRGGCKSVCGSATALVRRRRTVWRCKLRLGQLGRLVILTYFYYC